MEKPRNTKAEQKAIQNQKEELKGAQSIQNDKKIKATQNEENSFGPPPAPQMPNGK